MFTKRILKQSQKNGNQLSALFHGGEKASFETYGYQVVRKAGPAPEPWGDTEKAQGRYSAGGKCSLWAAALNGHWGYQFWKQAFIFQSCRLSAAAGWRKDSERSVPGAPKGIL